jgi:AhpD family alkylhydroperoxidase
MRVPTRHSSDYPLWLRPFFASQRRHYGEPLTSGLVWGRVPRLFAAIAFLYGVLDRKRSPVDPVLRSLITVRVSQINWCAFCVDLNSATLAKRARSHDKVEELENWRESALFDARERAVLEYAEAVTYSDRQVSDEMVRELRNWFDDDGLVELTGLIAFQNLSSKFNAALDIPAQGFCRIPPRA